VGPSGGSEAEPAVSSDVSLVAIEVPVVFTIDEDIRAYEELGPPETRDAYLTAVAERELSQVLAGMTLTDVLAVGKERIAQQLRDRITAAFTRINPRDRTRPGPVVRIVSVGVQGVHPPRGPTGDVTKSFEDVLGQEQKLQANVLNAQAEAAERLVKAAGSTELARQIVRALDALEAVPAADPGAQAARRADVAALIRQAGGEAASLLHAASAERWARHMGERTALATYLGRLDAYTAAPAIYRAYLYFDVLKTAMADARLYITDPFATLHVRTNLEDKATEVEAFGSQAPPENP
jgi:regulator of protease activity HflC (stomatin/prohibitin superfamily)